MNRRKDDQGSEAERILERVRGEGDIGSSLAARSARRARDHFGAADTDPGDRVELWGTRIGRLLALVFAIVLAVWLIGFLTRN